MFILILKRVTGFNFIVCLYDLKKEAVMHFSHKSDKFGRSGTIFIGFINYFLE